MINIGEKHKFKYKMKLLLIIFSSIILFNCDKKNYTKVKTNEEKGFPTSSEVIKTKTTVNQEKEFSLPISTEITTDSTFFREKLNLNNIYKQINLDSLSKQKEFDHYKISLPF